MKVATYLLRDTHSGEIKRMTVLQIIEEINRDRSAGWEDYNETDWKDGLELTDYELVTE